MSPVRRARRKKGSRSYSREPLRTIVVNRARYDIHVDSDGEFSAHVAGDYLKSDRMEDLIMQIKRSARKTTVAIAIPVTVLGHHRTRRNGPFSSTFIGYVHDGTIIGYHPDESVFRIRFEDGAVETLEEWGTKGDFAIARRMTVEEAKTWERLRRERDKAEGRFDTFTKRFEIKDLRGKVKAAYNAAIDTPEEPEDEGGETGDPRLAAPRAGKRAK